MDRTKEIYQYVHYEAPYTENEKHKAVRCLYSPKMVYNDKRRLGVHYHDYFEILYTYSGMVECHIDGTVHVLQPGDLIVINSHERHRFWSLSRTREHVCIQFDPYLLYSGDQSMSFLKNLFENLFENTNRNRVFKKEVIQSTPIPEILSGIIKEWYERDSGYDLFLRAKVIELFGHIYRLWDLNSDTPISIDNETIKFAEKVKSYIEENYASATEPKAARQCGLSVSYFSKLFNKTFNKTFRQYLTEVRVHEAEKILTTSDINITICSELVGFSSPGYFTSKFKEIYGMSPKKYTSLKQKDI